MLTTNERLAKDKNDRKEPDRDGETDEYEGENRIILKNIPSDRRTKEKEIEQLSMQPR